MEPHSTRRTKTSFLLSLIRKLECPVFLVLTKIDLIRKDDLLPIIETLSRQYKFAQVIPSARASATASTRCCTKLLTSCPRVNASFPKTSTPISHPLHGCRTHSRKHPDRNGEEVPYAAAVVIEEYEEPEPESKRPLTRIAAAIYCERTGQKAILIGKGGEKLKAIGTGARRKIESLLGTRVFLQLHVIVEPGWRESNHFIESLDWRNQLNELAESQSNEKDE